MKKIVFVLILIMAAGYSAPLIFAEENGVDGVAGCGAVRLDPSASLDEQQTICRSAEGVAASSCAASGNGLCSSPKLNDTMPDANHCLCIAEETVPAESELIPSEPVV